MGYIYVYRNMYIFFRLCAGQFNTSSSDNPLLSDENNVTLLFRAPDYGGEELSDAYYRGFRMCVETGMAYFINHQLKLIQ